MHYALRRLLRRAPQPDPYMQAHRMTMAEVAARLDRIVPPGSVAGAPSVGRPHPTPIRSRRYVGENEEVVTEYY